MPSSGFTLSSRFAEVGCRALSRVTHVMGIYCMCIQYFWQALLCVLAELSKALLASLGVP